MENKEIITLGFVMACVLCLLIFSIGYSRGRADAYGVCLEYLDELHDEIEKIYYKVVPQYESEPCDDCPQINITAWDSHTK